MKNTKNWQVIFQYALGGLITLSVIAVILVLMFVDLAPSVKDALLIMLGVLASGFMAVINYFYGSSKGSSDKTELIKKQNDEVD